jgi:hypothetical protein
MREVMVEGSIYLVEEKSRQKDSNLDVLMIANFGVMIYNFHQGKILNMGS